MSGRCRCCCTARETWCGRSWTGAATCPARCTKASWSRRAARPACRVRGTAARSGSATVASCTVRPPRPNRCWTPVSSTTTSRFACAAEPAWPCGAGYDVRHGRSRLAAELQPEVAEPDSPAHWIPRLTVERATSNQIGEVEVKCLPPRHSWRAVSYTHLRAHETPEHLVCRLLLEKK